VVCCLDLHVGIVKAPVSHRRATIGSDNVVFFLLYGITSPRI